MKHLCFLFIISLSLLTGCVVPEELDSQPEKSFGSPKINKSESERIENLSVEEDLVLAIAAMEIDKEFDDQNIIPPQNGEFLVSENEEVSYTPFLNFSGKDQIVIEFLKNDEIVFKRIINIDVTPVNDAPVASNDSVSVQANTELSIDVLANDTDVDEGDKITVHSIGNTASGTVSIVDGKIQYKSIPQYQGKEILTYTIKDSEGAESNAELEITVSYQSPPPPAGEMNVPVRLVFLEDSEGHKVSSDYGAHSARIIEQLNESYMDGTDKMFNFYLDSQSSMVNDKYFEVSTYEVGSALDYFRRYQNVRGKVNIYFVGKIVGGTAGVAYLNQINTTTAMFELMPTEELEKVVVAHEIGHNIGMNHVASNLQEDRFLGYASEKCGVETKYLQSSDVQWPFAGKSTDGWDYGDNTMFPTATYAPVSFYAGKYKEPFTQIMNCWHMLSGWP